MRTAQALQQHHAKTLSRCSQNRKRPSKGEMWGPSTREAPLAPHRFRTCVVSPGCLLVNDNSRKLHKVAFRDWMALCRFRLFPKQRFRQKVRSVFFGIVRCRRFFAMQLGLRSVWLHLTKLRHRSLCQNKLPMRISFRGNVVRKIREVWPGHVVAEKHTLSATPVYESVLIGSSEHYIVERAIWAVR